MRYSLLIPALGSVLILAACAQDGPGRRNGRPPGFGPMPREAMAPAGECLLKPLAAADSGALSRQRMDSAIKDSFARADLNGDGALDTAEVRALNASRAATCDTTPQIDWSGTGQVGLTAYGARYRTAFAKADIDGDGIVSREEMTRLPRQPRDRGQGRPSGDGPRDGGPSGPQIAGNQR